VFVRKDLPVIAVARFFFPLTALSICGWPGFPAFC